MKGLKKGKWYSVNTKPDKSTGLIVMTDMGYIFESVYEDSKFLVSIVKNGKVYFEEWLTGIIKWMRVQ